jgi:ATP-dependent Lon protease
MQLLKLPDGTVKVLVEGVERARIQKFTERTDFFEAEVEVLPNVGRRRQETEGAGPHRLAVRKLCEAEQEGAAGGSGLSRSPTSASWPTPSPRTLP